MSILQIEGLTPRQRALADVMWILNEPEDVLLFIHTLPKEQREEATVVMELMIWAMLDTINDTNIAEAYLQRYML